MPDYQHLSAPCWRIFARRLCHRPLPAVINQKDTDNLLIISVFSCFWEAISPFQVEPGGVEPPSKLAAKMLSTRLVSVCLSARGRYGTNQPRAYLLNFAHASKPALAIRPFMILLTGRRAAQGFRGSIQCHGPCPGSGIRRD